MTDSVFAETYTVVFDWRKPDGFWEISRREDVEISYCTPGFRERDNHALAQREIEKRYPSAMVKTVLCH